jgi:hypothetical protein
LQNCSLNRFYFVSRVVLPWHIAVAVTAGSLLSFAAPGFASSEPAPTSEPLEVDSQVASDLGTSLEINCQQAMRLNLTLFYAVIDGEQVPVDCLSLLRFPGDPVFDVGGSLNQLADVEQDLNQLLDGDLKPASTQLLQIEF